MTVLRNYWAKSPPPGGTAGEPLTAHLSETLEALQVLRRRVGLIELVPEQFWRWAALAALFHDAGKVATGFQRMIGSRPGKRAIWGQRHEVLSLGFVRALLPTDDHVWVGLGVLTHHRPLSNDTGAIFTQYQERTSEELAARLGDIDHHAVRELARWLAKAAGTAGLTTAERPRCDDVVADAFALLEQLHQQWRKPLPRHRSAEGLTAVLLQGAVTLADHVSSAKGELLTRSPLTVGYHENLSARLAADGCDLAPHQRRAATVDGHMLLRAPTGSGKTEGSLLWASRQIAAITTATGGVPRLFYVLPYLASINAMTERLERDLKAPGEIGVAHSRAGSYHLARSACPEDDQAARVKGADKAIARAHATKLFRELVRVGTPYQLMRGALAGPAHAGVLLDAANSVFIFDELHAYDPYRLGMILATAGFWARLGGRIAVVSATLPTALADLIAKALGTTPTEVSPGDAPWPTRHRVRTREEHLTDAGSLEEMRQRLRQGHSVLVVANNVADARDIYSELAPTAEDLHGSGAAMLLHSRFRRQDRNSIETRIRERFGTRRPRRPGLLVATQVVEVSLDVDFDVLFTSAAVLEALLQRFGRVNRLGRRVPADVVVHRPAYGTRRDGGSTEYADGVYEAAPTRIAWSILTAHDGSVIDERAAQDWLNQVYDSDWGRRWAETVQAQQERFTRTFLDFRQPFDDRSALTAAFDAMFGGVEAILDQDRLAYQDALEAAPGAAGKLLAADYLLPLPSYGPRLATYDHRLEVPVISAEYTQQDGLIRINGQGGHLYSAGEVL